jgi:hypothetical protein
LVLALVAVALFATPVPTALGATPLTGEIFTGTGLSTGSGSCPTTAGHLVGGSGTFTVSGTATGSYAGSFVAHGNWSFWGDRQPYSVRYSSATFTVTSGTTTITGTDNFSYPGAGYIGFSCGPSGALSYSFYVFARYTVVIHSPGEADQTYQGPAKMTATFDTDLTPKAIASVSETFTG